MIIKGLAQDETKGDGRVATRRGLGDTDRGASAGLFLPILMLTTS